MYVVYINLLYFLSIFLFTYNKNLLSPRKCSTDNDVTYIIMPRIAQESSIYLFPLWSFHNKIAD